MIGDLAHVLLVLVHGYSGQAKSFAEHHGLWQKQEGWQVCRIVTEVEFTKNMGLQLLKIPQMMQDRKLWAVRGATTSSKIHGRADDGGERGDWDGGDVGNGHEGLWWR